jgi:hypothetical protein
MVTSTKQLQKKGTKKMPKYRILGRTSDGVSIIRPKMKSTHFTSKQIRKAILEVKKDSVARKQ